MSGVVSHLYLGPSEEERDVIAVLSGENGHCFLPVLDVHTVDLSENHNQNQRCLEIRL